MIRILGSQPNSSLIQCNGGDKVLLRFANLGYQQQSMQLEGIPMKMIGEDANILRGPQTSPGAWGVDLSYFTDTDLHRPRRFAGRHLHCPDVFGLGSAWIRTSCRATLTTGICL